MGWAVAPDNNPDPRPTWTPPAPTPGGGGNPDGVVDLGAGMDFVDVGYDQPSRHLLDRVLDGLNRLSDRPGHAGSAATV